MLAISRIARLVVACMVAALTCVALPMAVVQANAYTVTTLSDAPVHTGTSLRDAIASATSGTDTITFQSGLTGAITLAQGTLTLAHSVTITGPGTASIAVDGGNSVTVFTVNSGVTATIQ